LCNYVLFCMRIAWFTIIYPCDIINKIKVV